MDESDNIKLWSAISGRRETERLRSANTLIFRALLSIASATLLIRVVGLGMQIIVTSRFGEGEAMDAYLVAVSVPLLLASIADTLLESAVIPVYAKVRAQRPEQITSLFSTLLNLTFLAAIVLTGALVLLRTQVIFVAAPSLNSASAGLATALAPIIFPVFLLMTVASLLQTVLNAEGQFGWPAYAGVLVPFSIAVLAQLSGSKYGVAALCVGMLIGVCLEVGVFLMRLRRARVTYRLTLNLRSPGLATVALAVGPVLLGSLIGQINPFVDQIFASSLAPGSISALSYALKLVSVPVGVIFASAGRAALPYLSRQAVVNDMAGFKRTFRLYVWLVGTSTAILAAGMYVFSHLIVRILFQRGAFTVADTNLTSYVLQGFLFGLAPMALVFMCVRAFNALGRNYVLVYASVVSVIANAALDYILARYWQGFGIALATSVVYLCTMCFMLFALRRMIGKLNLFAAPFEILGALVHRKKHLLAPVDSNFIMPAPVNFGQMSSLAMPEIQNYRRNRTIQASESIRHLLLYLTAALGAAGVAVATTFVDPVSALRLVVGIPVVLASLRYRFLLLLAWAGSGVLNGAALPVVQNNHPDVPLIPPTLLLMCFGPLRSTLKRLPALAVLLLFLLWVLAGINISPLGASEFLKNWFIYLSYIGLAVLAINILTTRARIFAVIDLLLLVATLVSLYGIVGYVTHQHVLYSAGTGHARITSIFTYAPPLALFLTTVIPVAFFRILTASGVRRSIYLLVMLILLTAIGLTFTRSAIISVPIVLSIFAILVRSRTMRVGLLASIALVAIIALVLVTVGNIPLFDRFSTSDLASLNGRTYLWEAIINHFDPRQIFGRGLGSSNALLTSLQIGQNGEIGNGLIATSPSNLFIGTLYDNGIVGVVLLGGAFLTLGLNLISGVLRTVGERQVLFVAAFVVLINMLVQSLDANDFWTQSVAIYFWIIIALPFAVHWSTSQSTQDMIEIQDTALPETTHLLTASTSRAPVGTSHD